MCTCDVSPANVLWSLSPWVLGPGRSWELRSSFPQVSSEASWCRDTKRPGLTAPARRQSSTNRAEHLMNGCSGDDSRRTGGPWRCHMVLVVQRRTTPCKHICQCQFSHPAITDKLTLSLGQMLTYAWLLRIAANFIVTVSRFTVLTPR